MLHSFTYNGHSSSEYGLYITSKQSYNKPERNVTFVSIPGRNGDLIVDNGGYQNLDITLGLRLFAPQTTDDKIANFNAAYNQIAEWLKPTADYYDYTDTYVPGYYRKAAIKSALQVTQKHYDIADFNLKLSCKPFKYRNDGAQAITIPRGGSSTYFTNPENETAAPIIRVFTDVEYNASTTTNHYFNINGQAYCITNINGYVDIDCETMNAYKGADNMNSNLYFSEFPTLPPGENRAKTGTNTSKLEIIPRWRAL